jgi:hypothetical protein
LTTAWAATLTTGATPAEQFTETAAAEQSAQTTGETTPEAAPARACRATGPAEQAAQATARAAQQLLHHPLQICRHGDCLQPD